MDACQASTVSQRRQQQASDSRGPAHAAVIAPGAIFSSLDRLADPSGDSASGSNQLLFDVLSPFATVLASHDIVPEYALDLTGET